MIVTFLVVMNKSIPPRIFFQLLPRFPLTCAKNPVYYYCCAGVAQLVEQLIRNQQVAGSSPATSSIKQGAVAHPLKKKDRSKSQKRLYNFGLLL